MVILKSTDFSSIELVYVEEMVEEVGDLQFNKLTKIEQIKKIKSLQ